MASQQLMALRLSAHRHHVTRPGQMANITAFEIQLSGIQILLPSVRSPTGILNLTPFPSYTLNKYDIIVLKWIKGEKEVESKKECCIFWVVVCPSIVTMAIPPLWQCMNIKQGKWEWLQPIPMFSSWPIKATCKWTGHFMSHCTAPRVRQSHESPSKNRENKLPLVFMFHSYVSHIGHFIKCKCVLN